MGTMRTVRRIGASVLLMSGIMGGVLTQAASADTVPIESLDSPAPAVYSPMSPLMPIWRVQLFVRTANAPGASLDFAPTVKLNGNNSTLLNRIGNDFQPGVWGIYDLRLDGVTTASTISNLTITVPGGHDWCMAQWSLVINEKIAASQNYGDPGCARVTPASPLVVSGASLRSNPWWIGYGNPALPTKILASDLANRIESIAGHVLWGSGSGLATPGVQLTKGGYDTVKVTLNVAGSTIGFLIKADCDGTVAKFTTTGLSGAFAGTLASAVASQLNQAYGDITYRTNGSAFCPTSFRIDGPSAYVSEDGTLQFRKTV